MLGIFTIIGADDSNYVNPSFYKVSTNNHNWLPSLLLN